MKTITKTFYIDQGFFLMLLSSHKNKCEFQKDLAQFFTKNHNGKMREIQISWQEPERKIEITESEFEAIISKIGCDLKVHNFLGKNRFTLNGIEQIVIGVDDLKKQFFGASDE